MSVEKDDWRLQGQKKTLDGRVWTRKKYKKYKDAWDHDHCEFCSEKLMEAAPAGVLDEGYSTDHDYYWVCVRCFDDFKEMFSWTVASETTD